MIFPRMLNLPKLLTQKSFFLFGSRATGKSFLIRQQFNKKTPIFDLLRSDLYIRLTAHPEELEPMIEAYDNPRQIVIDEVQRIPMLLNEVHRLIEEKKWRFLLTGSSARKLRRGHVNLLAGRAWEANLFSLTTQEIPKFNLIKYLQYGGLPVVYSSALPQEELFAYVNTYLKEEIQAEALVRTIPAFSRFLEFSALTSGTMLNFTSVANDAGVPVTTIREYYQILEDTFIGFVVPAWQKTKKRKPVATSKFYFFDLGVKNTLANIQNIPAQSDLFGQAFEHFIALELRAYLSYRRIHLPLSYWRSKHGYEVDFILGDDVAIEVKAANKISEKHLKSLKCLQEEKICKKYYVVSQDKLKKKQNGIFIYSWQEFLKALWQGKII